jgi:hypothetical protein
MLLSLTDIMPSELVILGDFGDFYAINAHGKHPEAQHLLTEEVDKVNQRLDLIDAILPDCKKVFIEGNHEYRLERYIIKNAPALFGVTSTEYLFQLNARPNWTFVPYSKRQAYNVLGTDLIARHEPLSMSSPKASLTRSMSNMVYGHKHVIEECWGVSMDGRRMVNFSPGWLGDERYTKIFGYAQGAWQRGFSVVTKHNKMWTHEIVRFRSDNSFIYNGKVYK